MFLVPRTEEYRSERYYGVVILNIKRQTEKKNTVLGASILALVSNLQIVLLRKCLNELGATVILSFQKMLSTASLCSEKRNSKTYKRSRHEAHEGDLILNRFLK